MNGSMRAVRLDCSARHAWAALSRLSSSSAPLSAAGCLENGWNVEDPDELRRWRDQEPINAHSHMAAMLLGSSETVPVTQSRLVLGQWQSVMLVDTDGPRERKVGIQAIGFA